MFAYVRWCISLSSSVDVIFFSSLSFYHGLDMFLASRDDLVINGNYPGFFTSSFVLGTLLNLNPVGCPTKNAIAWMPLSCDELTERWKASAAASELKAVKQLQIVLVLHSLFSSCLLTTIWLQYCRFCTIWCLFAWILLQIRMYHRLLVLPNFLASYWCLCMGWYYSMSPDPWHL